MARLVHDDSSTRESVVTLRRNWAASRAQDGVGKKGEPHPRLGWWGDIHGCLALSQPQGRSLPLVLCACFRAEENRDRGCVGKFGAWIQPFNRLAAEVNLWSETRTMEARYCR
jgi:hypothetical protein